MFYRIFRQLTVQGRLIGAFSLILCLMVLYLPLVDSINMTLTSRLQQLTDVDVQIDRRLLIASKEILSVRVNLLRYTNDLALSPAEALANIEAAAQNLKTVQGLKISPEELTGVNRLLDGLQSYDTVIRDIQLAKQEKRESDIPSLASKAYFYASDLELEISQALRRSESRIDASNRETTAVARSRLLTFQWSYLGLLVLSILIGFVLERSITRPILDLQNGTEDFRSDRQPTHIQEAGNDELTRLARSFNQLTEELSLLYQNLEQQVAERTQALSASFQISQKLASILDPQTLTVSIVDEIKNAFGYYHVHIYLFDEPHENLVMMGGTGEPGEILLRRGHSIPRGRGLVGRAAENNQVVLVDDTRTDPGWLPNPLLPETESEVAVPIASGENVLGVLDVQENRKSGFSPQAVELLQAIANQAAVAVQNSRLYQDAQHKAEIETRASQISQRIQAATTIEAVLQIGLEDLSKALGVQRARAQVGLGSDKAKEPKIA